MTAPTINHLRVAEGWFAMAAVGDSVRRFPVAAWAHVRRGTERAEVVGMVAGTDHLELVPDVISGSVFYQHSSHLPACRCAEAGRRPTVEELDPTWCESCPGTIAELPRAA
jgi:hypothetical protein